MSSHIVLLGDSIFDNATYTGGEPDVLQHLRAILPEGWDTTLCAVDGSTTGDLMDQLGAVPSNATHLVVSTHRVTVKTAECASQLVPPVTTH